MRRFVPSVRLYVKMRFDMFVWDLYDKCADYLERRHLIIKVDPNKYEELEDENYRLEEELLDKTLEIYRLETYVEELERRVSI